MPSDGNTNPFTGEPYSDKYFKILEGRLKLPVWEARAEVLQLCAQNRVVLLVGETGSGKTTQIPQFLLEWARQKGDKRMIGCTQPRRVAAMSVAQRVSEEMDVTLGQTVGYSIRFEEVSGPLTQLKYMTDGMLLREAMGDPQLSHYGVLLLDEAHERTLTTDILLGLIKELIAKRSDLCVIVMSATLDAEKFRKYFPAAPLVHVQGRRFPVEILYTKNAEPEYRDAAVRTALQIHCFEPKGDILIFLTGEQEIEEVCEELPAALDEADPVTGLPKWNAPVADGITELVTVPLFASLPPDRQRRVFRQLKPNQRKCVVATNIAESSITIDGIVFVIDSGFVKQKVFNPRFRIESLLVTPISQASANQRSGRAGRTQPGRCFRLYTERAFNSLLPQTYPEIVRSNLDSAILQLKQLGITDLVHFDFLDPPAPEVLMRALENLHDFDAIDDQGALTPRGHQLAEFPLDPNLAVMLLDSPAKGCSQDVATIVALLSIQGDIFLPNGNGRRQFQTPAGDHITLRNTYRQWEASGCSVEWCRKNGIHERNIKAAKQILQNLLHTMKRQKIPIVAVDAHDKHCYDNIRKGLLCGNYMTVAMKGQKNAYTTVREHQSAKIHPASCMKEQKPEWVMFQEYVLTTGNYLRTVSPIDPRWLFEVAPQYYGDLDCFPASPVTNALKKVQAEIAKEQEEELRGGNKSGKPKRRAASDSESD